MPNDKPLKIAASIDVYRAGIYFTKENDRTFLPGELTDAQLVQLEATEQLTITELPANESQAAEKKTKAAAKSPAKKESE